MNRSKLLGTAGSLACCLGAMALSADAFGRSQQSESDGDSLLQSLEAIEQLTLADLLKAETTVASVTPISQRSSPGILTVVTREEILASGARDLVDVLNQVPGFSFGVDMQGVVGAGFRGNWGHEGKVLLQVDGHELNEGLFLTTQFGSHVPVDQIERVEVIRGPGSVVYGGSAELAVINVVTRKGKQLEGPFAAMRYGTSAGGWSRRTLSLGYGQTIEQLDGLEVSASGYFGQARRGDREFVDLMGNSFAMRDGEGYAPAFFNLNASWRGLKLSYLFDDYSVLDQTGMGEVFAAPVHVGFGGHYLLAAYEHPLAEGLKLKAKLRYKRQQPWRMVEKLDLVGEENLYDRGFDRLEGNLSANWTPQVKGLDISGGLQAQLDRAWENADPEGTRVGYRNFALFAQAIHQNPIFDFVVGARGEYHEVVGFSFVPRVAATKIIDDLHLKAIFSRAFKAPGVANIELNPDLRPERTQAIEFEAGFLFGPNLYASLNVFDITIEDPIVYGYDPETDEESYVNFSKTGSAGAEAVLKYRHARGFANFGYGFSYAGKNEVPVYAVPGSGRVMLGMPQHKVSATGSLEVLEGLSLAPSVVFMSSRSGFAGLDEEGAPQLEERPAAWLVDLYATWRPKAAEGLTLSAGVHNLLDEDFDYLQPYNGGQAALPDTGREFGVRLAYEH